MPSPLVGTPARHRAATSLRRLSEQLLLHEAGEELLAELTGVVDALTEQVASGAPRRRAFDEIVNEPGAPELVDGEPFAEYDQSFISGPSNPVSTPGVYRRMGDGIELWTTVSIRHEGMPGFAHGGILAAIFDNVIGMTMGRLHRVPAPTVQTDVTFVRPVPLDTEIVFRAELTGSEGRKRTVTASAWVGGTLHASAVGVLVVLREDQLAGGLRRPAGP